MCKLVDAYITKYLDQCLLNSICYSSDLFQPLENPFLRNCSRKKKKSRSGKGSIN